MKTDELNKLHQMEIELKNLRERKKALTIMLWKGMLEPSDHKELKELSLKIYPLSSKIDKIKLDLV